MRIDGLEQLVKGLASSCGNSTAEVACFVRRLHAVEGEISTLRDQYTSQARAAGGFDHVLAVYGPANAVSRVHAAMCKYSRSRAADVLVVQYNLGKRSSTGSSSSDGGGAGGSAGSSSSGAGGGDS